MTLWCSPSTFLGRNWTLRGAYSGRERLCKMQPRLPALEDVTGRTHLLWSFKLTQPGMRCQVVGRAQMWGVRKTWVKVSVPTLPTWLSYSSLLESSSLPAELRMIAPLWWVVVSIRWGNIRETSCHVVSRASGNEFSFFLCISTLNTLWCW